ncbi:MAG: biopolymer transporter ExbD [Gammaproteobacteria bacterium]|nr:biopolymer transporter ExbD [Gammaproteobacteria bacterium]
MRKRLRRHGKEPAELDITAFLNLMVILIPFLLITAVFSQITILELNLPPADSVNVENDEKPEFLLEVIIHPDALQVSDRPGRLLRMIPLKEGQHDYKALTDLLSALKTRFPDKQEAMILSKPETTYDTLIQVMDNTRMVEIYQAGSVVQAELFPDISLGDAP